MYRIWIYVIFVIYVTGSEMEVLSDCIGCKNDQPELNEFLKSQKIAHRLEYIKQQLISNLHVENPPKKPPKFDSLPDFLVHQLVDTTTKPTTYSIEGNNDEQAARQMVLFAEDEVTDCHHSAKNRHACFKFKLSEEILSIDISSVAIWFHKKFVSRLNDNETHNFTIIDTTMLNTRNRYSKNVTSYHATDKDGWYQIDVTTLVKPWQFYKSSKHRTLTLICDTCNQIDIAAANTTDNHQTSFLLLNTDSEENSRYKRGVECVPGKDECCREDLYVDFSTLGEEYKMVLNPTKFNAYVCRGNCYPQSATDAHKPYATLLVMLKLHKQSEYSLPTACCTPTKFSSLPVFYASDNLTIKKTSIPNMIVESCGCI